MLLVGADGASVELSVVGYQFDVGDVELGGDDWDANWLVIAGRVQTGDGRTWASRHPGLTTWEVADAVVWLERAARGEVPAVPAWTHADDDQTDDQAADQDDDQDDDGDDDPRAADGEDVPFWWDELDRHGWLVFTEPCLSLGVAETDADVGADVASADEVRLLVGLGAEWAPPPFPEQAHDWRCVELRLPSGRLARAAAELREELARFPPR